MDSGLPPPGRPKAGPIGGVRNDGGGSQQHHHRANSHPGVSPDVYSAALAALALRGRLGGAPLAGLAAALVAFRAGVRRREEAPPVRSARAAIRASASSSVTSACVLSFGRVALTPSWVT